MQLWVNGNQEGGDVTDATISSTISSGALHIGCRGAGINYLDGKIGEIIIFTRALNSTERKSVEQYLRQKCNVAVN